MNLKTAKPGDLIFIKDLYGKMRIWALIINNIENSYSAPAQPDIILTYYDFERKRILYRGSFRLSTYEKLEDNIWVRKDYR